MILSYNIYRIHFLRLRNRTQIISCTSTKATRALATKYPVLTDSVRQPPKLFACHCSEKQDNCIFSAAYIDLTHDHLSEIWHLTLSFQNRWCCVHNWDR
jgi:hypothetical protein